MRFKEHSRLIGVHAFLSPSSYHWVNYDHEKLTNRWKTIKASIEGVAQHYYAAEAVELREQQASHDTTLGMYINDCIYHRMVVEQVLYYSDNCFGTADAIFYEDGVLRIFDLKTGATRASPMQLVVYAAIFCLEYDVDPFDLVEIDLRIYQDDECQEYIGEAEEIRQVMDKIVMFDGHIDILRIEEGEEL